MVIQNATTKLGQSLILPEKALCSAKLIVVITGISSDKVLKKLSPTREEKPKQMIPKSEKHDKSIDALIADHSDDCFKVAIKGRL
jgi:hypothetical protein